MNIEAEYKKYQKIEQERHEAFVDYNNASKVSQLTVMFGTAKAAEIAYEVVKSRVKKYRRLNEQCEKLWRPEFLKLAEAKVAAENQT